MTKIDSPILQKFAECERFHYEPDEDDAGGADYGKFVAALDELYAMRATSAVELEAKLKAIFLAGMCTAIVHEDAYVMSVFRDVDAMLVRAYQLGAANGEAEQQPERPAAELMR